MIVIDTLAQPRMLFAVLMLALLSLLLTWVEQRLQATQLERLPGWLLEHIYLPLARIGSVLIFIALAYPTLYGIAAAPPLSALLQADSGRTSVLINLTFLLSLLLPWIPLVGRLPGLIMPAQGLLAAAMIFSWLAQSQGVDAQLWPGWLPIGVILLGLYAGQRLAAWLAQLQGAYSRQQGRSDWEAGWYAALVPLLQLPAMLYYTTQLGQQLTF